MGRLAGTDGAPTGVRAGGSGPRRLAALAALAAVAIAAPGVWAASGTISTVAGNGTVGFGGDGGPATSAQLNQPVRLAATGDGGYLIADLLNHRVRRVSPGGTITTVAGNGVGGFSGDGGPATGAQLNAPAGVALTADGGFLIGDRSNHRVRRVSPGGTITTVAGTGVAGFSGDGGPATSAQLRGVTSVAVLPDGGFLVADRDNHRVRRVSAGGTITTVAGTGVAGFSGDGGPATAAQLNVPDDLAPTADGGFLIVDEFNDAIRRVSPGGTITTVAGTGVAGFSGDGGPATSAQLDSPTGVAVTGAQSFLVSDTLNDRVRWVAPDGTITTVAGSPGGGFAGDGGPATSAQLQNPNGILVTPGGGFLFADRNNARIRFVDVDLRDPSTCLQGAQGCWRFGEASGTALLDASGNGNHGTYLNGPLLGQPGALMGDPDTAASFDGLDDLGRIPDADSLDVGDSLTVEGWIKRSSTARTHQLFNKGGNGLHLVVMNAGAGGQVHLRKANVTTLARSQSGVPADDTYHHVVATVDGPNSARIYIDGVEDTVQVATAQSISDTALPLYFGSANSTQARFDEFALYDHVLTADDVLAHFAAGHDES